MADAPIRVAHVITRMILGGAQENTLHVCDALNRDPAWQVLLVTGPPLGPEGELLGEVRRRRIPHVVVPQMRRAVNPLRDAAALGHLARILRRWRPAIVHTHSSKAGILGRWAAWAVRTPIVIHTVEGLPFHPYGPPLANLAFKAAERLTGGVTDRIACVAQAMVDQATCAGISPRDGYSIIYSGIDADACLNASRLRDQTRRRLGFAPEDVVIGKVARLFPLKGHAYFIRAAARIAQRCPSARFLLVGDGILKSDLQALALRLGIWERMAFAGLVPPEEVPAMISAMDVVVHTSLREGLARVLVEALLCGKPVVAYALDGTPEVIINGVTGRLVPAESVGELADAVLWAIENPSKAQRMAEEGRRLFADRFRIETMAQDTLALYRDLLRLRPHRPA